MNKRKRNIAIGGTAVGLGVAYLVITSIRRNSLFKKIKEAIGGGVGGSLDTYSAWFDPNYYKSYTSAEYINLSQGSALSKARELNDGFSWFNDDESQLYSVLRSIPDGVALSFVSEKFTNEGFGDLKAEIEDLDKDEVAKVSKILQTKPPYRRARQS